MRVPMDETKVARCRELAGKVADDVQRYIDGHTSVGAERTFLRAYGVDGVDDQGAPLVNLVVDRYQKAGLLGHGISHWLGRALATLGQKDVALTQLDMAFKIDPGSVEVLRDLGVLALEANDLERAQKTFRALLLQRLDSQSGISKGEVFYYLGEICMKQGDKAKAVQMLERAVENDPNLARAKAMLSELKN